MTAGLGCLWEVGGKGRWELAAETVTLSYPHPGPDKGLCVWDGRAGADVRPGDGGGGGWWDDRVWERLPRAEAGP